MAVALGLRPFNPPLNDAQDLEPTKFKPKTQNRMSVCYNCVCVCLSYLLTGRGGEGRKSATHYLRTYWAKRPSLRLTWGSRDWVHSEDVEFINIADLRILARYLKTNIYMWWPADDLWPARWLSFSGTNKVTEAPAFYLAQKEESGFAHCVAVSGYRIFDFRSLS